MANRKIALEEQIDRATVNRILNQESSRCMTPPEQ
jgi:hypothetical protein